MTLNQKAWFRYMARSIDMTIGTIFIGLVFGLLLGLLSVVLSSLIEIPWDILKDIPEFFVGVVIVFLYLIVEASMFSSFKTSLGKKLFGISVTDSNNKYLEFSVALKRNFTLWFRGMALSIPLLSFITMVIAYQNYIDKGITSWDHDNEVVVHYKSISKPRVVASILLFIVVILFNSYLIVGM